jgi:hypothetical protein
VQELTLKRVQGELLFANGIEEAFSVEQAGADEFVVRALAHISLPGATLNLTSLNVRSNW